MNGGVQLIGGYVEPANEGLQLPNWMCNSPMDGCNWPMHGATHGWMSRTHRWMVETHKWMGATPGWWVKLKGGWLHLIQNWGDEIRFLNLGKIYGLKPVGKKKKKQLNLSYFIQIGPNSSAGPQYPTWHGFTWILSIEKKKIKIWMTKTSRWMVILMHFSWWDSSGGWIFMP